MFALSSTCFGDISEAIVTNLGFQMTPTPTMASPVAARSFFKTLLAVLMGGAALSTSTCTKVEGSDTSRPRAAQMMFMYT